MTYSTTITKKGQITIPRPLREFFRLKENSKIILEVEKDKKSIKIKSALTVLDLADKFKPKKIKNALKIRERMNKLYRKR